MSANWSLGNELMKLVYQKSEANEFVETKMRIKLTTYALRVCEYPSDSRILKLKNLSDKL